MRAWVRGTRSRAWVRGTRSRVARRVPRTRRGRPARPRGGARLGEFEAANSPSFDSTYGRLGGAAHIKRSGCARAAAVRCGRAYAHPGAGRSEAGGLRRRCADTGERIAGQGLSARSGGGAATQLIAAAATLEAATTAATLEGATAQLASVSTSASEPALGATAAGTSARGVRRHSLAGARRWCLLAVRGLGPLPTYLPSVERQCGGGR